MELTYPRKNLKELVQSLDIQLYNSADHEIAYLSQDSRDIKENTLFFARAGLAHKGESFIRDAIAQGATAICHTQFDPELPVAIAQLVCPDISQVMGEVASLYFDQPSKSLTCVGVTGTSGKTTVTYLVHQMLSAMGEQSAVIGTTGILFSNKLKSSTLTTLDAITLQKELYCLKKQGCSYVALEVSSHALDQNRAHGLYFHSRIYTNLSEEHLDYHKTMQQYAEAKSKLFKLPSQWATTSMVANADDAYQLAVCPNPSLSYGIEKGTLRAKDIQLLPQSSRFKLSYPGSEEKEVEVPLTGKFNIYNFLAAFGSLIDLGFEFDKLLSVASILKAPPGRLELVKPCSPFDVYVDYSHKPDALKHVLLALKAAGKGKLFLVFGCGGNRDREKRPLMARIAAEYADRIWITNDNPRNEDPILIAREITKGFKSTDSFEVILDRKEAIAQALGAANPGDTVLIAGKGHECYQLIKDKKIPFDDLKVAMEIMETLQTPATRFES